MRPPADAIQTAGCGPDLILVHGTGMDGTSLAPLARLLEDRLRVTRYHRRGTPCWPGPGESAPVSVREHAGDLGDLAIGLGGGPVHLFGVSFGAVVALELARLRPELVRSAVLFEPAVAGEGEAPGAPAVLLASFEKSLARGEPERAAERFHRRVLSEALWRRLSPEAQGRARGQWRHIHGDLLATVAYRISHTELRGVDLPVLLLRGGRSREVFESPLRALAAVLPRARHGRIELAGHQTFGSAWGPLAESVAAFVLG
jgi:pimeloyl-ACP methyl ester carboxylesterase